MRYHDWGLLAFAVMALLSIAMSSCNDERKDTTYPRQLEITAETLDVSPSYANTEVTIEFDRRESLVYRIVKIDGVKYIATKQYDGHHQYFYSLCPYIEPTPQNK